MVFQNFSKSTCIYNPEDPLLHRRLVVYRQHNLICVLRWEFLKENKKIRKQENKNSTKKAIKEKKENKNLTMKAIKKTRTRPRKKGKAFLFFLSLSCSSFLVFLFSYFLVFFINSHLSCLLLACQLLTTMAAKWWPWDKLELFLRLLGAKWPVLLTQQSIHPFRCHRVKIEC